MHGDPQHGGSVTTISIGDTELASVDHEALEAHQPDEGEEDAHGQRLRRIQPEDERGRDSDPASEWNPRNDPWRGGGNQGSLFGPANGDGGNGLNGSVHDPERIGEQSLGEGIQSAQNQITAFHVPAQALPKALELGASLGIEKVIQATDRHTIETTQQRLMDGSFQFWSATENGRFIGCMITEVVRGATGDTLHIPYMAGERPTEWAPMMIEVMAPMVEEAGLEAVTTETREGMRKFLISLGWRKVSINMRLDLDNGRQK